VVNEQEMAAALGEIRSRRVESWRARARQDVAIQLLEEHGSVTADQVDAEVDRLPQLTEQALADQVAAKTVAAVDHAREQRRSAAVALEGAGDKVEKCQAGLAGAEDAVTEASRALEAADQAVRDAEALAEYAGQRGDPTAWPSGGTQVAKAGVAHAEGSAG
jgi:hypothetical protein